MSGLKMILEKFKQRRSTNKNQYDDIPNFNIKKYWFIWKKHKINVIKNSQKKKKMKLSSKKYVQRWFPFLLRFSKTIWLKYKTDQSAGFYLEMHEKYSAC